MIPALGNNRRGSSYDFPTVGFKKHHGCVHKLVRQTLVMQQSPKQSPQQPPRQVGHFFFTTCKMPRYNHINLCSFLKARMFSCKSHSPTFASVGAMNHDLLLCLYYAPSKFHIKIYYNRRYHFLTRPHNKKFLFPVCHRFQK